MAARTGSQFLEGLRKTKREIWVDGERIADVTAHPKLRGGAEILAAIPGVAALMLMNAAPARRLHDPPSS